MSIKVYKIVVVDGKDYQRISSALEMTRRYINTTKHPDGRVNELSPKEVAEIETAMSAF